MIQILALLIYLVLIACQLIAMSGLNEQEYWFHLMGALVIAWVGAYLGRLILKLFIGHVNQMLNSPGMLKTSMNSQSAYEAIRKVITEYEYQDRKFEITKESEATHEFFAKWGIRLEWMRFLLLLTPWEMTLHNNSMDVTFEAEVTQMSPEETEVDIQFTNEADPETINLHGYIVRQKITKAIHDAVECTRTVPREKRLVSRYDQASDLLDEGRSLYDAGKFKRALKTFKNAVYLKPDRGELWAWVAYSLDELDRPEDAATAYQTALDLNEKMENVWMAYAEFLSKQGKTNECVDALRQATAKRPDCVDAWHHLALALDQIGETREAEQARRKLATLHST
jgi:tetratricopeptide (TPR) repeat protein